MKAGRFVLALVLCLVLAPAPASAHTLLSELLLKILLSDIVLSPPAAPFQSHEAHFRPIVGGEVVSGFQVNQLEVPLAINSIMASQLATIPLGSSSGGFSYKFDSALGSFTRESSSFGSAFVDFVGPVDFLYVRGEFLPVPGCQPGNEEVTGISPRGEPFGSVLTSPDTTAGFLLTRRQYTLIQPPGALRVIVRDANARYAVGEYYDGTTFRGFVYAASPR